jgi:hypothetical protein
MSFLHKVVSGRLSKLNAVSFSKVASVWKELGVFSSKARISLVVREKVMSEVEVEATGERRDSRVSVADRAMRNFFLSFNFESALVL